MSAGGHGLHPREYIATTRTRRGQAIPTLDMDRLGRLLTTGVTILLDATELARAATTGTQTDRDRLRRLAPRRPLRRTTSRSTSGRGLEQAGQTGST
ncbi:hypothetical protein BS329_09790 [Amycolatopsis coloradensis]|uniref:Uncharacterized protein n=1 Tax=Amycolatopsis coloradensis TaxID=76021 RepID=A0A1R0KVS5_9PSEU|nr:hypothetical protein [Amycolatopsis coloradensis]OLZ53114.1 hypothetical protein BS329_09790 [Amycolatopsis coloradensis]